METTVLLFLVSVNQALDRSLYSVCQLLYFLYMLTGGCTASTVLCVYSVCCLEAPGLKQSPYILVYGAKGLHDSMWLSWKEQFKS